MSPQAEGGHGRQEGKCGPKTCLSVLAAKKLPSVETHHANEKQPNDSGPALTHYRAIEPKAATRELWTEPPEKHNPHVQGEDREGGAA